MGMEGFLPRIERGSFLRIQRKATRASTKIDVNTTARTPSNRLIDQ